MIISTGNILPIASIHAKNKTTYDSLGHLRLLTKVNASLALPINAQWNSSRVILMAIPYKAAFCLCKHHGTVQ